jgi:hypothetical protein
MNDVPQQYFKDIRGRRNSPKGQLSVTEEIGKKILSVLMLTRFPAAFTYALVEFKQGRYRGGAE